ncbi:MAG: ankyrin repeat domain-containing protein [Synergistaceae bacterium]|nr:ankyrin repeat domain-containing protein [Synergistaceae bacterium]
MSLISSALFARTFKKISDRQFLDIAKEGSEAEIIEAINRGANVNARDDHGGTALVSAAEKGRIEIVKALIKSGAHLSWEALMYASANGHVEVVNFLIKAGADLHAERVGWALRLAAKNGHIEAVNALIKAGANVNADPHYKTALMYAAENGHVEVINALIEAGADVNTKDGNGKTAIDYARYNDKLKGTDALKRLEELSR